MLDGGPAQHEPHLDLQSPVGGSPREIRNASYFEPVSHSQGVVVEVPKDLFADFETQTAQDLPKLPRIAARDFFFMREWAYVSNGTEVSYGNGPVELSRSYGMKGSNAILIHVRVVARRYMTQPQGKVLSADHSGHSSTRART